MSKSRLEYAIDISREAGELTLEYFHNPRLVVDRKEDDSPVTAADRGAELLLRQRIEELFPQDAIFGEEFPMKEGTSEYRWILDPIDGTKSFIHGVPIYSTLIGITKNDEPIIGVIRLPALHEAVWAAKGEGAWHESPRFEQPIPAHVSDCKTLGESLFLTSEVLSFAKTGRQQAYNILQSTARLSRSWGDAYGYFLVATGRAEVMVDPIMSLWDAAPLQTIIEEAGGRFTDWQGNPTIYNEEAVATNSLVHDEVLKLLKEI